VQYEVDIEGRLRQVTVQRDSGRFVVELDGRRWTVDAARVDGHSLSLLIGELAPLTPDEASDGAMRAKSPSTMPVASGSITASREVTVAADGPAGRLMVTVGTQSIAVALNGRRRGGPRGGASAVDGPQRLLAPMPGKVLRVLAQKGDPVHARQPLIVIEAMKMENELRAGRDGIVSEIHAREGQSVEAGELLAVVSASPGPC